MKNLGWLQKLKEEGKSVPTLDDMPTLLSYAVPYWEAFVFLSARRHWIDGYPQFIPISEIAAYADYTGWLSPLDREELLQHISRMDEEYVSYKVDIARKKSEEARRKSSKRRPR